MKRSEMLDRLKQKIQEGLDINATSDFIALSVLFEIENAGMLPPADTSKVINGITIYSHVWEKPC